MVVQSAIERMKAGMLIAPLYNSFVLLYNQQGWQRHPLSKPFPDQLPDLLPDKTGNIRKRESEILNAPISQTLPPTVSPSQTISRPTP
jgi:hypothetical protein